MVRLPTYIRPELTRLDITDKSKLESMLGQGEKLAENMWLINKRRRYGSRGFISEVVIKNGKDYYLASMPTDAKGIIPATSMAERIMDIADGDRNKQERNLFIDVGITAKNTHKPEDRAKAFLWFLYPNEGDIKGIDDANTKIVTVLPKSTKANKRSLILMGGTNPQREMLAKVIDDNFTIQEKKVLAGVMFNIKSLRSYAGMYQRARVLGQGGSVAIITVDPRFLQNLEGATVTIHEAIHALRDRDTKRIPELRRRGSTMVGRDSDLEESLTEGETVGRERPLTTHDSAAKGVGYYPRLKKPEGKSTRDIVIEDRVEITEPSKREDYPTSGKRGKRVQKLLVKHFPDTHISKLQLKGRTEAIDTYWETRNRGGIIINTQAFSPRAIEPDPPEGGLKTIQFHDGKAKKIRGKQPAFKRKPIRVTPKRPKLKK